MIKRAMVPAPQDEGACRLGCRLEWHERKGVEEGMKEEPPPPKKKNATTHLNSVHSFTADGWHRRSGASILHFCFGGKPQRNTRSGTGSVEEERDNMIVQHTEEGARADMDKGRTPAPNTVRAERRIGVSSSTSGEPPTLFIQKKSRWEYDDTRETVLTVD